MRRGVIGSTRTCTILNISRGGGRQGKGGEGRGRVEGGKGGGWGTW